MSDQPATKRDLDNLERDLKQFILEREITSLRWFVGLQVTYFAVTLGAMWFLVAHMPK